MSDVTDAIERVRRAYAERAAAEGAIDPALEEAARAARAARSLTEILSADELALIVEPKRATPRRGTINPELDVAAVASECQAAGASAISIVTEPELSGGSIEDLRAAAAYDGYLPVIARDFIVDVRQVYELRAAGADALLIPASAHQRHERERRTDDEQHHDAAADDSLAAIVRVARGLGMEVVLSVCSDEELAFALDVDVDVLNIDNRDEDGRVDAERTFELLADVPVGWPVISELIAAVDQVPRLHRAGVDALLLDEGHLDTGLAHALAVYADLTLDG